MPSKKLSPRERLEVAIEATKQKLRGLSSQLRTGKVGLAKWQQGMESRLKTLHVGAAILGNKTEDFSPRLEEKVTNRINEQLDFLFTFAGDVAHGTEPVEEDFFILRSEMYADAARGTFEEALRQNASDQEMRWERWILEPLANHCEGCLEQASLGWVPLGTLPEIGSQQCLGNCHCHYDFSPDEEPPEFDEEAEFSEAAFDCGTGAGGFQPGNECGGKGGGGGGDKEKSGRSGEKEKRTGPSKKSERKNVKPPKKDFVAPPPPQGTGGKQKYGFAANGETNTKVGDGAEAALKGLGLRSILPPGQRQNPLDVEYDHSGYAFEVKACTTNAKEYKAKPKKAEVASKNAYAKKHGLKPATMIAVVDSKAGQIHAYWREGIGAYRLDPNDGGKNWNFMGTVKI